MQDAFRVLDTTAQGTAEGCDGDQTWIDAFKTISWVVESGLGLRLTADGG